MKKLWRCEKIANCYYNMAEEAHKRGEFHNSFCYNIKALRFYNIVSLAYSKITLIFVTITAVLQVVNLIKIILT